MPSKCNLSSDIRGTLVFFLFFYLFDIFSWKERSVSQGLSIDPVPVGNCTLAHMLAHATFDIVLII